MLWPPKVPHREVFPATTSAATDPSALNSHMDCSEAAPAMIKLQPPMSINTNHQMSPDFIPHSATQNPPPSNLPPTDPKFHDINHKCSCPGSSTVITVVGISCKRTLELCPLCPASTVFLKLYAIISHDQKESWIPASVVDIATVGFGGQYLGRRFQIYVPEPNKPPLRFWRRTVRSEPDLESKHDPAIEVQLLAGVLLEMAEELRTIELRLLRGRGEMHAYRIIAVVMITVVVLLGVACAWLKDANPGIAAGGYWLQSILLNLVSSLMFGGIAWTLWRPRDE